MIYYMLQLSHALINSSGTFLQLGVCGLVVVPLLWRLGGCGFGAVMFGTLLSLELKGSREDILYDEIYIMIIEK